MGCQAFLVDFCFGIRLECKRWVSASAVGEGLASEWPSRFGQR